MFSLSALLPVRSSRQRKRSSATVAEDLILRRQDRVLQRDGCSNRTVSAEGRGARGEGRGKNNTKRCLRPQPVFAVGFLSPLIPRPSPLMNIQAEEKILCHVQLFFLRGFSAFCFSISWASSTAMAAMFTMSLTSTPRWSTCTGFASPCRIGPITSALASRQSSL